VALAAAAVVVSLGTATLGPGAARAEAPASETVAIADLIAAAPAARRMEADLDDPVYKRRKRYAGVALADLLRQRWPTVDDWATAGAELVLTAADGYSPSMDLGRALAGGGVVAVRDLDRPPDDPWEPFLQGKETITPAPYYLVWPDADPGDPGHAWPYQLVSLRIEPVDRRWAAAAPGDGAAPVAREGFRLWARHCAPCHSVNLVGGSLGPELNVPMSVTEYWPAEHLAGFIAAPERYRARSKMPGFAHLPDGEQRAILAYLAAMVARKTCGGAKPCE